MNAIEMLTQTLEQTHGLLKDTLGDFTEADMLERPTPGANHAAWQLAHLIAAEGHMMSPTKAPMPVLPVEIERVIGKEGSALDSPADFPKKDQLLALFSQARQAAIAGIKTLSESDLDKPTGFPHAPTVGLLLALINAHTVMHIGQLQVIRRKLGKPVMF